MFSSFQSLSRLSAGIKFCTTQIIQGHFYFFPSDFWHPLISKTAHKLVYFECFIQPQRNLSYLCLVFLGAVVPTFASDGPGRKLGHCKVRENKKGTRCVGRKTREV